MIRTTSTSISSRACYGVGLGYLAVGALALFAGCGSDDGNASPTSVATGAPAVSFTSPADGAHIAGAIPVQMAATGLTIEPAGEAHAGAGHFHVIADGGCITTGDAIPKDATHVHFGKGQTDGSIYVDAGAHTLCLQVGDGVHAAQPITDEITVDVGVTSTDEWCAVASQIDEITDDVKITADSTDEAFADAQLRYANALHLENQLEAGLDQVDEAAHDDVAVLLDFFAQLAHAVVGADSATSASAGVDELFATPPDGLVEGGDWMSATCGVDTTS